MGDCTQSLLRRIERRFWPCSEDADGRIIRYGVKSRNVVAKSSEKNNGVPTLAGAAAKIPRYEREMAN